ncbi:nucleotidyl transferase AbiEii/AbiGii toxin family protein [Prevotella cerevisiae]|uniref:Nucleotidyl transferase AbiEii/AbiGii toxin family protein n=1 Tax=Segatella cerevisiae TaxID=2053716 RepID=A0ABT1BZC7_9BACT|nr:nucleotidyl transferase AbiEii/AbiGii toxin family protein [Segatella cerevisiae]MCO6026445.1 nucleotidyl transferase AbiEii/AbiGii toxin family protein [Segatella cerevisiae]
MKSYSKSALDNIARQEGFIRDNLEKVMRLADILDYFHRRPLLSRTLALKGGTAINLAVFKMPRLSIDIDLDFSVDCDRDTMMATREQIRHEILRYMVSEGYTLSPASKMPHALDSWIFLYRNAVGNNDAIKIEINYSDRCHVFDPVSINVEVPFLCPFRIRALAPIELFATKINALIGRAAARDIYDVDGMITTNLFPSQEEREALRKTTLFYLTVGSSRKSDEELYQLTSLSQMDKVKYAQIRTQLLPVLRKTERFDFEKMKKRVRDYLQELLQFTDREKEYFKRFRERVYSPELLFDSPELTKRVAHHPMALWKMGKK